MTESFSRAVLRPGGTGRAPSPPGSAAMPSTGTWRAGASSVGETVGRSCGNLLPMEVHFVHRPDGGVDARVADDESVFNEVFANSINAIAPAGAPEPGAPSTYWLDRARAYAIAANEDPSANPIAHGNVTIVTVENGSVVARFDFDPDDEPGERIPVEQLIEVLDLWREKVLARSPSASENYPTGPRVWTVESTSPPSTPSP